MRSGIAHGVWSLVLVLGCASSAPAPDPAPPGPLQAAEQPPKPKTEDEQRKEKEAGLEEMILNTNLVAMEPQARARVRALTFGELAEVRFDRGDLDGAVETIEKAEEEAKDARDEKVTSALDRSQFLILRFAALDAAKDRKFDRSMKLFDKMTLLPRMTRAQRDQVGGDRLLVIEMRGDQNQLTGKALTAALARIIGPTQTPPTKGSTPGILEWTAEDLRHAIGQEIGKDVSEAHLPSAGNGVLMETGSFDPGTIVRVVSANKKSVTACYSRSLKGDRPKKGKLELLVTVQPTGVVSAIAIDTPEFRGIELGRCIQEAVGRWRFPPFRGEARQFSLPFVLQYFD
jgi:hypothetical protein